MEKPAEISRRGVIDIVMAIASGIGLIWQIKLAHIVAKVSAPIGAAFTLLEAPYKNLKAKLINISAINMSICIDILVVLIEDP
jgi:hypothetical protein